MRRENTSRPTSSVPNQCASEGALRTVAQLCAVGSYGAMTGASKARSANSTMSSSPKTAALRMNRRRTARTRGLSAFSVRAVRNRSSSPVVSPMSGPQPRIDQNAGDVGQQIEHDVDRRRHQDDALDDGIIAVEHGIDDQLAES